MGRNPSGVADGFLREAWVQVQRKGILKGPYYNAAAAERRNSEKPPTPSRRARGLKVSSSLSTD
jgi:hypothetical protein